MVVIDGRELEQSHESMGIGSTVIVPDLAHRAELPVADFARDALTISAPTTLLRTQEELAKLAKEEARRIQDEIKRDEEERNRLRREREDEERIYLAFPGMPNEKMQKIIEERIERRKKG